MNLLPILVSHHLCPYVQRAAIALTEKGVAFRRRSIDLANKPDWFLEISPLGKVPLLQVGEDVVFESSVIVEYLEETQPHPLHPGDPLERARHRGWIEFASSLLNDIAGFYNAPDRTALEAKATAMADKFRLLDRQLGNGPWFAGEEFSLVDAAFGPVFRYFDTFDRIADFAILNDLGTIDAWRVALAGRASVRDAVDHDYPDRLIRFLIARRSYLSGLAVPPEVVAMWREHVSDRRE